LSANAKRVSLREVADAAGLSPAAVSYALRGIQVSAATQERVRKLADELGYELVGHRLELYAVPRRGKQQPDAE